MAKITLKRVEELFNEIGCPDDDHPENGGRVPWRSVNTYGSWLRRRDPIAFRCAARDMRNMFDIVNKVFGLELMGKTDKEIEVILIQVLDIKHERSQKNG